MQGCTLTQSCTVYCCHGILKLSLTTSPSVVRLVSGGWVAPIGHVSVYVFVFRVNHLVFFFSKFNFISRPCFLVVDVGGYMGEGWHVM